MMNLRTRFATAAGLLAGLLAFASDASAAPLFPARPTAAQTSSPFAWRAAMPRVFETEADRQAEARAAAARAAAARAAARPKPEMRPLRVMATAYALRGHTASGAYTRMGTIAVDPRVIPMGTRLYVPGYGWGQAQDTGGAVRGNVIDLWMPSTRQCFAWGVRSVDILVEVRKPRLLASRAGRPRNAAKAKPAKALVPPASSASSGKSTTKTP